MHLVGEVRYIATNFKILFLKAVAYPGILFGWGGGVSHQTELRIEDRENGDLRAVAPLSGVLEAAVIWYKKFHLI